MDNENLHTVVPLPLWFIVLVSLLTSLPGCATLPPPCERFGYNVVHDNAGQPLVLFDMENVDKLIALITGLSDGKCRLPKDGEV